MAPTPPRAKRVPRRLTQHGETRVDEYAWLRDKENPAVIAHLEAENQYSDAVLAPVHELRTTLYDEFIARLQETDLSVPVRRGEYFYYHRFQKGKQYAIHCRRRGSLRGREEVILDENVLARGKKYFRIETVSVSPDHRYLAYTEDLKGAEEFTLRVRDLSRKRVLPDAVPRVRSVAWSADSTTLFYAKIDDAHRPFQVWRHRAGDVGSRELVLHEEDPGFYVYVHASESREYVIIHIGSKTTSEEWFLPAPDPWGEPRLIQPRARGVLYSASHHGQFFYIVTNHQALNFKLVRTPVVATRRKNWVDVIAHRPKVKIDGVHMFRDWMAVFERRHGYRHIQVRHMRSRATHSVEFDEPVYTVTPGANPEYATGTLRLEYTSLVTPREVLDYDMSARKYKVMKRTPVLGGYRPARYASERIFARAEDGTHIPISVVYRKGTTWPRPMLLQGYGSYGMSSDPYFSTVRLSLLDRGFVVGIAHVRGGGEMGRPWYYDGKLLHKKNSFTDFIACAEHLVEERYTTPERLVAMGGSAGGLLMGAIANMRPDLFLGIVASVPFVDVLNTMSDPALPLTVLEYDEWGNPDIKRFYRYIKSYAPYENVDALEYPHVLATAGLQDPRVGFWEPAKWVARLRDRSVGPNLVLLHTKMSGHFGASGRYSYLHEIAREYAFILHIVGATR